MNRHILSGWAVALLAVSALGGTSPGAPATDSLPPATGWRVAELNGAPGLYRDGKPVAPVLFWQWELLDEDVRAMAGAGVDLFATFGSFGHYGASTSRGTPLRRSAARPWRRPASPTPPRP